MANKVFYSFHFKRDVHRIQLVRNFDALDPDGTILDAQAWESVKRQGRAGIEKWIKDQMAYKKAVIVLIGYQTASRPWVQYEIDKAWADKRPLLGIRIHGLAPWPPWALWTVLDPTPSTVSTAATWFRSSTPR